MEISNNIIVWHGLQFDLWIIGMTWVVMAFIIGTVFLVSRRIRWIPRGWQNVLEMTVEFIENNVKDSLGKRGVKYSYFFGSLFLFILI